MDKFSVSAQLLLQPLSLCNGFLFALTEALQEQRKLFHDIFAEVLEDFALVEAIREGRETELASRSEIDALLEARP